MDASNSEDMASSNEAPNFMDVFGKLAMTILERSLNEQENKTANLLEREKYTRIDDEDDQKKISTVEDIRKNRQAIFDQLTSNIEKQDHNIDSMVSMNILVTIQTLFNNFLEKSPFNFKWEVFPTLLLVSFFFGNVYMLLPLLTIFFYDNYLHMSQGLFENVLVKIISMIPILFMGREFVSIAIMSKLLLDAIQEKRLHLNKLNYILIFYLFYFSYTLVN